MNKFTNVLENVLGLFEPQKHINSIPLFYISKKSDYKGLVLKEGYIVVDQVDHVPIYILEPAELTKSMPAVLCLHQTTQDMSIGADEVIGKRGVENYSYALELAKQGFVTISPDYPLFGKYSIDLRDIYHTWGYESVTMKGIVNHMAAVNVLESLNYVDNSRIGCIGHSLGGTNALFSTYFDKRLKATVVSAGFTSFRKYAETSESKDLSGWSRRDKYMPNILTMYDNSPDKMPFDFNDLLCELCNRPLFASIPKKDEVFDYEGALSSIKYALNNCMNKTQIEYITPDYNHNFHDEARAQAYKFLINHINDGYS